MIIRGPKAPSRTSEVAYHNRMNKSRIGSPNKIWKKLRVECDIYGKEVCNCALTRYKKNVHDIDTFRYVERMEPLLLR